MAHYLRLCGGVEQVCRTTQKKVAKLKMKEPVEKRRKEVVDKALAERDTTQETEKWTGEIEHVSDKGARSPSPEIEEETDEKT